MGIIEGGKHHILHYLPTILICFTKKILALLLKKHYENRGTLKPENIPGPETGPKMSWNKLQVVLSVKFLRFTKLNSFQYQFTLLAVHFVLFPY